MVTAIAIAIGCAVVFTVGGIAIRSRRWKVVARRIDALYQAASAGDRDQLRRCTEQGHSINQRDYEGNTALHLAYYDREQGAVDALVAYGADDNLRNKEGLSPVEMGVMAVIEDRLNEGIRYLGDQGDWLNEQRGWVVYDQLKQQKPRIYNPALVRCAMASQDLRKLLHLAIKLGIRGSEGKLVQVLRGYGTKEMAVDYLNAGSEALCEAAEAWARRNNYRILHAGGRVVVSWGRF